MLRCDSYLLIYVEGRWKQQVNGTIYDNLSGEEFSVSDGYEEML